MGKSANEMLWWGKRLLVYAYDHILTPDNDDAIAPPLLLRDQLLGSQKRGRKREAPFFILILLYRVVIHLF